MGIYPCTAVPIASLRSLPRRTNSPPDCLLSLLVRFPSIIKEEVAPNDATSFFGAGDGNRTHATSLEGWDSTIELHPHSRLYKFIIFFRVRQYLF